MRKLRWGLLFLLLMACLADVCAQQPWEPYLEAYCDIEEVEEEGYERIYETLCELSQNPFDINSATREDFQQLPFLDAIDIENLCAHLYHYAPMRSLGELAMIESIDHNKRQLLSYFVYVGEEKENSPTLSHMMKYGGHTITTTASIPMYERRGDKNGYLGYPYKHQLRYEFKYSDLLKAGVVAAQDAGEPFFANKNGAGYDFYSFYVMMKKRGIIKNLVVGKYRANFGMGLVLNNDFLLGKSGAFASLSRNQVTFRPHSSTLSGYYLQGAASTLQIAKHLDLSAFISYRAIDATLNSDDETIATVLKSGYHRTASELNRKNNAHQFAGGTNLRWRRGGFVVGASLLYTSFSRSLRPNVNAPYREFYPSGKDFWNASVNYGYSGSWISFAGETATGDCGAIATLNTLNLRLNSELSINALQRFYGKKYYAIYAQSFSEGNSVQDESGVYVGMTWQPSRKWRWSAYTDFAYFAWPKYQASLASRAWDNLFSFAYTTDKWEVTGRYRLKMRQKDNSSDTGLLYKNDHRGRFSVAHSSNGLTLKTQCDIVLSDFEETSFGWMATQHARYAFPKIFDVSLSFGYFHTDDFNSRVYTYERGTLYSFNMPVFYGEGIRSVFLIKADITKKLKLQARLGTTKYFDRSTIGTGYQLIDHSSKTDLGLALSIKL